MGLGNVPALGGGVRNFAFLSFESRGIRAAMSSRKRIERHVARWLVVGALTVFSNVETSRSASAAPTLLHAGPMVGHVGATEAKVWYRAKLGSSVDAVAIQGEREVLPTHQRSLGSGFWIVEFGGLAPETETEVSLRLAREGSPDETASARFRTAPRPSNSGTVRIAFGSCSKVSQFGGAPIYGALAEESPDMMLYLGDNSYFIVGDGSERHFSTTGPVGDWTSIEGMIARHLVTRTHSDTQLAFRSIPSYAVWDDHDYGPNNADREFDLREEALLAFQRMWANPSWGIPGTPGVFSSFRHGPVEVFLMDDRYHKYSPLEREDVDVQSGHIWGPEQTDWLIAGLRASTAPVKVIANGTQVISASARGEGHFNEARGERERVLRAISSENLGAVVFLSGDRHHSEAMRLPLSNGGWIVEGTSSPLQQGQEVGPLDESRSHPNQLWGMRGNNFGLLTIEVGENGSGYVQFETRDEGNENPMIDGKAAKSRWALSELRAASKASTIGGSMEDDNYLWLEEVEGDKALAWARRMNTESETELTSGPEFAETKRRILDSLNSQDRIPRVSRIGDHLYNFWKDDSRPRGVYRRTTLEAYRRDEVDWETVLDLDALAEEEDENWVWGGIMPLAPEDRLGLVFLSRGGADAEVVREFDLEAKAFVEGGFHIPEAKSSIAWKDENTLYLGTDFGEGSLTDSGYPRQVRELRRGEDLASARLVFEGEPTDVSVRASVHRRPNRTDQLISRSMTFWTNRVRILWQGDWTVVDKPDDARLGVFHDQFTFILRSDWEIGETVYPAGSLLVAPIEGYMSGEREMKTLFEPSDRSCLDRSPLTPTRNWLIVNTLEDVRNRLFAWRFEEGEWRRREVEAPEFGAVSVASFDSWDSDDYWITADDFLTPATLYLGAVESESLDPLKSAPTFFDAEGLRVEQAFATSADGTRVPYFMVSSKDLHRNGDNPTLLYGYGGFEIALQPGYSAALGTSWLERGGVYVLANIRGGGEFGPKWHQAALKENRQRAYDDFIAVAEDLIAKGVTSPRHLGIRGGSNGGLLMGNMLVQRPDLFHAIVCQVPLLDMKRYNKLLAGASWMGEYGNPDVPEEWAFLKRYSPYQLVRPEIEYPRLLVTTSTRDDRVHPGHARKMVAKMKDQGHEALYFENIEGGHGGAANNEQSAFLAALYYTFLWKELSDRIQ